MKGKKITAALCALAVVVSSSGGLPFNGVSFFDTAIVASADNLENYTLTLSPKTLTYTGKEQRVSTSVKRNGDIPINAGTDYTISGDTATDVGIHEVTVTGSGSFSGELKNTYEIVKADLNGANVIVPDDGFEDGYIYAYSEWENVYCYAWGNNGGSDSNYFGSWSGRKMDSVGNGFFRIAYPELVGSDTAINFIFNNGTGTQTGNLYFDRGTAIGNVWFVDGTDVTIKNKDTVAPAVITLTKDSYALSGGTADAEISKVIFAGVELVKDTDYEIVGCTNNTTVGTGTITIKGKGNYTGEISKTYTITETAPAYTITIPESVNIDGGTAEFKAENVTLPDGAKINITVDGENTEAGAATFNAKNEAGNSTVQYTINNGSADVADGGTAMIFTGNGTQTLTFTKTSDPTYAGKHTETLTFGVTLEQSEPATVAVSGITIDNAPTEALFVNSTGTLTATVSPDNATDKTVVWSSSDPDYVSINAETGEYTVMGKKGYGSATITATATNGTEDTSDDVKATCTITGKVTYTSLSVGTVLHTGDTFYTGSTVYFQGSTAASFTANMGVITIIEATKSGYNNKYYQCQRGSNGTYPNWAYVVKDNTDGIYITGGSGTKSDKFTLAVHTK